LKLKTVASSEYDTPFKLIERCGDLNLPYVEAERLLSRIVYSGRVRLEKSPGQPLAVEELKAWITRRGLPPGYLPYIGVSVDDVCTELRRPRPVLVCTNKNPLAETGRVEGGGAQKNQLPPMRVPPALAPRRLTLSARPRAHRGIGDATQLPVNAKINEICINIEVVKVFGRAHRTSAHPSQKRTLMGLS
jgi:hypothetical protein